MKSVRIRNFFLICIFLHPDWIRRFNEISVFSPNVKKYRHSNSVTLFLYSKGQFDFKRLRKHWKLQIYRQIIWLLISIDLLVILQKTSAAIWRGKIFPSVICDFNPNSFYYNGNESLSSNFNIWSHPLIMKLGWITEAVTRDVL